MKEKESDKAHRIAISKHFPVSYYGVSMAPSGPRTIAQVCTLEYCHPANGNKDPKRDNPKRKHELRGEECNRRGKGDLWNANWASSPYWSGTRVPIQSPGPSSSETCEGTVVLVSNTLYVCTMKHSIIRTIRNIPVYFTATGHLFRGALESMIDCLIHSAWCCQRRGLQVYISSHRSIFS